MSHSDSTSDPDIDVLSTALLKLLQRDQSTDTDKQESLSQEISAKLHSWSMGYKAVGGRVIIKIEDSSISKELRSERDTLLLSAVCSMQGPVSVIVQVPASCSSGSAPGLPAGTLTHAFVAGSPIEGTALLAEEQVIFKISVRETGTELGVIPFAMLEGLHGQLGELCSDREIPKFSMDFQMEPWTRDVAALSEERMAKITAEIQRLCDGDARQEELRGLIESRDLRAASALYTEIIREGLAKAEQMTEIDSTKPVFEEPFFSGVRVDHDGNFKSSSNAQDNT